ncbi:MAG: methyltransferase domain-containing protein [Pseudomonadota bacterium]
MITRDNLLAELERLLGWEAYDRLKGPGAAEALRAAPYWRVRDAYTGLMVNVAEARAKLLSPPLPPDGLAPYSDRDIRYMTASGLKDAARISDAIDAHAPWARRVLDFGCGTGRLTRFLAQFRPDLALQGCDVNAGAVAWMRAARMPGAYRAIAPAPPTAYADSAADVVFAWSIFSHFSEAMASRWLAELTRLTAPGGLVLLTIHRPEAFEQPQDDGGHALADPDRFFADFAARGFAFAPSYDESALDFGVNPMDFGDALISEHYIRRNWSALADVVDIVEVVEGWQDLVVLRKP